MALSRCSDPTGESSMMLWSFDGGLHLDGRKQLACDCAISPAPLPTFLILPLLQHLGEPTQPIVQVGAQVLKGQIIAQCQKNDCSALMSAPIHASSSGTVVAIEPRPVPHPSGLSAPCIVIETDGADRWISLSPLRDYAHLPATVVRQHIAQSGIVGLGGAGFPAHMKLKEGIDTLIINGAECEPYITCDDRLMREYPQELIGGAAILMHVLGGAKRCVIAIEDNKPEAFAALTAVAPSYIEIIKVPTRYPTGGERQLIQVLTGQEVGRERLPASVGIVMQNVETTRAIYRAVAYGRPLISRVVTVTGGGVHTPKNLEVLVGTPMRTLVDFCQPKLPIHQLIMGGPMMGFSLPHDDIPVVKTTNCLIATTAEEMTATAPVSMPCIRCGACADVCPMRLLPQQLYWYAKAKDFKKAQEYHLFDCIDCGCCAYVCPSHIPLVNYYRYAKAEIRNQNQERRKADAAKKRHESRQLRLQREKAERAARHQHNKSLSQQDKEALIAQALDKAKTPHSS